MRGKEEKKIISHIFFRSLFSISKPNTSHSRVDILMGANWLSLRAPLTLFSSKFCTNFFKIRSDCEKLIQNIELKRVGGASKDL